MTSVFKPLRSIGMRRTARRSPSVMQAAVPSVKADAAPSVTRAASHCSRLAMYSPAAFCRSWSRTGCLAARATAASALTLGTAACMTLGDRRAVRRIPIDLSGLKTEVIVQKSHRYGYDHALLNCGIKFVEVETLRDYEAAFNEHTVMAHFFNAAEGGQISREDWIRVAHQHKVPCFNDAAADVPPIANLWNYTKMGFDLVTFSGGKGIRGPQNAGLLLGRADLIAAAVQNNSPNSDTIGRGMKVSKEQIVGMVAALDWFLTQTDAGMETEFRRRADRIAAQLKGIPTLESRSEEH